MKTLYSCPCGVIEMFNWLKRWRDNSGRDPTITACCSAGVDMRAVGDEHVVVCKGCAAYIGHITMREVALLGLHFKHYLNLALEATEEQRMFFEADLDAMCDAYINKLVEYAPMAAKLALAEHTNGGS